MFCLGTQTWNRRKKVVSVLMAILFVISLTVVVASAAPTCKEPKPYCKNGDTAICVNGHWTCGKPSIGLYSELYVNSIPNGADIYFDGKFYGKTPDSIKITDTYTHSVKLALGGYENWIGSYKFNQIGSKDVSVNLIKK